MMISKTFENMIRAYSTEGVEKNDSKAGDWESPSLDRNKGADKTNETIARESIVRYVEQLRQSKALAAKEYRLESAIESLLSAIERRHNIGRIDMITEVDCAIYDILHNHEQRFTFAISEIESGRIFNDCEGLSILCDLYALPAKIINSTVDWYLLLEECNDESEYNLVRKLNYVESKISMIESKGDSIKARMSRVDSGQLSLDDSLSLLVDLGLEVDADEKALASLENERKELKRKIRGRNLWED